MPKLSFVAPQTGASPIALPFALEVGSSARHSGCDLEALYVSKYVGLGVRTPSPDEIAVRITARNLKIPTTEAIHRAAPEMALLILGPCWLVPVPSSSGRITANLELCRMIAGFVPGARVKCALLRQQPVESSANRRKRGLPGLTVEGHRIIRVAGFMDALPVYFVDNVVTTGTTLQACRKALGWGDGLVYADASTRTAQVPVCRQS